MKRAAFALPLVIWSVALLTGLALLLLGSVSRWLDDQGVAERRFAARQHALTGLALGMNPAIQPGDPLLRTGGADCDGHEVRISNESARIDPNFWIARNEREIFQRLLEAWGEDAHGQNTAIDGMADWVDADDFVRLNGAERARYEALGSAGLPHNEPFASVEELEAVIGLQNVLAEQEGWREFFTVRHSGKISARHASGPMLTAVAGFSPEQAAGFLALRAGKDGIEGTDDDKRFSSLKEVASLVSANAAQARALEKFFSLEDGARRIESTGWAGGRSHRIVAIVRQEDAPAVLNWEER